MAGAGGRGRRGREQTAKESLQSPGLGVHRTDSRQLSNGSLGMLKAPSHCSTSKCTTESLLKATVSPMLPRLQGEVLTPHQETRAKAASQNTTDPSNGQHGKA